LKPLYDHFGKERAEEIIEIRWPSKPYPESKYSMSAYQPSEEELLAQRLPGYWRLRELIELSEAGALNGRGRDEMKALAAEFNFHWRMANGSDGSLFSTLNMWAGLTVAGQNQTINQLMSSLSSMAAVRPTPVRPNLRLEIKTRYTQQPVTSAPKTFTTKPTSESPRPKFKIQPVAPPAPLDKVQTAAPKPKVDVSKYREINLGSKGEAGQPDMLHLNIDLNEITREISGGKIAANYTSMPEIPSSHFEVIRGRNVQFAMPSEIVPTMKENFRIAKPGGTINISFTSNWDEVERALKEAGFVNVKRGARTYPFGLIFTAEKSN
jgi:hypothetical protein